MEGFEQGVQECEELLWRWREVIEDGDALLVREVVRETIQRVEIEWDSRPAGKRTHFTILGGVFHVWQDLLCPALHDKPCSNKTGGPSPVSTR